MMLGSDATQAHNATLASAAFLTSPIRRRDLRETSSTTQLANTDRNE
jgi:hypothetical protein